MLFAQAGLVLACIGLVAATPIELPHAPTKVEACKRQLSFCNVVAAKMPSGKDMPFLVPFERSALD